MGISSLLALRTVSFFSDIKKYHIPFALTSYPKAPAKMAFNEPNGVNGSASYINGTTNGIYTNGTTDHTTHATTNDMTDGSPKSKFDPNFTQRVIDLMSPETKPRHREILTSLIRHVHDFCREVELTQDEWVLGVDYINSLGQSYQKNRNETWRLCDILGVES